MSLLSNNLINFLTAERRLDALLVTTITMKTYNFYYENALFVRNVDEKRAILCIIIMNCKYESKYGAKYNIFYLNNIHIHKPYHLINN